MAAAAAVAARLTATQQQVHSPSNDMLTLYTVIHTVLRNLHLISHSSIILTNSSAGITTLNGGQQLNSIFTAINQDTFLSVL